MANTTINIPEGMELVKVDESHYEIRKKDDKVRSWEEFKIKCRDGYEKHEFPYPLGTLVDMYAYCKLLCLYRNWIGYWRPDWSKNDLKYSIVFNKNDFVVIENFSIKDTFSFPTKEMAEDFLNTFYSILITAKNVM